MNCPHLVYRFASAWREGIRIMLQRIFSAIVAALIAGLLVGAGAARGQASGVIKAPNITPATASAFGLYPGLDFRITQGDCKDCATPKQALWYFSDDLVAVPAAGVKTADFSRGVAALEDVKHWHAGARDEDLKARPPMLWLGAPSVVRDARLAANGDAIRFDDGASMPFKVTPKIKTNLSFYNESSQAFFQQRAVRMPAECKATPLSRARCGRRIG